MRSHGEQKFIEERNPMCKPRGHSSSASSISIKRNGKAAPAPAVSPQVPAPRPADDDRDAWNAYWQAQGQLWRTEPEVDLQRQKKLDQRRSVIPDIEQGIYPFKG